MVIAKTKKHQLDTKYYIKVAFRRTMKRKWWIGAAIFFGIILFNLLLNLVYPNIWIYFLAPIFAGFFFLFWYAQFVGATQLKQNQVMFNKYMYEIDNRYILLKINNKEAMQIKWDMIKSAEKTADAFHLWISNVQFIHLPFNIFNTSNDVKFVESILRKRNLLPATTQEKKKILQ
ncbi:MAG: hypothetical protein NZ551_03285 [Microscillaceae bacterium]|nr:hypothetical protein [Microscillaceae bacterium]MDW8460211.1 hypothetical protein [Cytophagales bacterium]